MEKFKKHLKMNSLIVLLFAGVTLLNIAAELFLGELNGADAPENILRITKIILMSVSLVLVAPRIYIGVKGMLTAKNPNTSSGHITWAIILLTVSLLSLLEPIINMISNGDIYANVDTLFGIVLDVLIYYDFIKSARAVRNEAAQNAEK